MMRFKILKDGIYFIVVIILLSLTHCSKDTTGLDNGKNDCDPLKYVDTARVYFYYYFDERIYLTLANDLFYALYDSTINLKTAEENISEYEIEKIGKFSYINSYLLKTPPAKRAEEFYTFYGYDTDCGFGNQEIVEYSTPIFWGRPGIDSTLIILTDEFIVNIDTNKYSLEDLLLINKKYSVELVDSSKYVKSSFILRVTKKSPLGVLDMANLYQDSAYAKTSAPNFRLFGGWLTSVFKQE